MEKPKSPWKLNEAEAAKVDSKRAEFAANKEAQQEIDEEVKEAHNLVAYAEKTKLITQEGFRHLSEIIAQTIESKQLQLVEAHIDQGQESLKVISAGRYEMNLVKDSIDETIQNVNQLLKAVGKEAGEDIDTRLELAESEMTPEGHKGSPIQILEINVIHE